MDVVKILPSLNFFSLSAWLLLIQYNLILDTALLKSVVKIFGKFQKNINLGIAHHLRRNLSFTERTARWNFISSSNPYVDFSVRFVNFDVKRKHKYLYKIMLFLNVTRA